MSETDTAAEAQDAAAAEPAAAAPGAEPAEHGPAEPTDEAGHTGHTEQADANALLVREGDIAADYLERLLDIADYDGDIDLDVENDRAVVAIVGTSLSPLIGDRGQTLDALQELTRLAVAQQTGTRSRLMLDISGHRQARRQELTTLAQQAASDALASGERVRLAPMNPFERKVVHDAVAAVDGVNSESEGEEPHRRVVVVPD